jgi:hypothetical protein
MASTGVSIPTHSSPYTGKGCHQSRDTKPLRRSHRPSPLLIIAPRRRSGRTPLSLCQNQRLTIWGIIVDRSRRRSSLVIFAPSGENASYHKLDVVSITLLLAVLKMLANYVRGSSFFTFRHEALPLSVRSFGCVVCGSCARQGRKSRSSPKGEEGFALKQGAFDFHIALNAPAKPIFPAGE